jgi:hypothetical protein
VTETNSGDSLELSAGTWVGAIQDVASDGRPQPSDLCLACHNGGLAPDVFSDWRLTGHAEIFSQNIDMPDNHWTADGCGPCHTVGYDSGDNEGFDDWMRKEDWTVPAGAPNNYANMFVDGFDHTASLGNVQCENCHGPNGTLAHSQKSSQRVSIDAQVCGACHGEPLRHGRYQQWQESGHSNFTLALEEGTVEGRGATAGHCGRCHSGQGFLAWIEQDDLTQRIQGASGDATVEELAALGLTEAAVQPQTCATCHDPHTQGTVSGEPNTATVRVTGDTMLLPAGFRASEVGRGALCITCHNTRNGAHNSQVGDPTSYSAPHVAAQGDVLMGQNAYFVTAGVRGSHSYVQDTCTHCHMELTPPPEQFSYYGSGTNHSFRASLSICSECHGEFEGDQLQAATGDSLDELRAGIASGAMAALGGLGTIHVRAYDPATHLYSSSSSDSANLTLDLDANPLASIDVTEIHGQSALVLTPEAPVTVTWTDGTTTSASSFGVQLGSLMTDDGGEAGGVVFGLGGNLVRATWNLLLLENDGSLGVHNPRFYAEVVQATLAQDLNL